jgi:hypothetical protein
MPQIQEQRNIQQVPPISIRSTSSKDMQGLGSKVTSARQVGQQPIKVTHDAAMQRPQTTG